MSPAALDALGEPAAKREPDYRSLLAEALAMEWAGRHQKGLESRLRQARLPWIKEPGQLGYAQSGTCVPDWRADCLLEADSPLYRKGHAPSPSITPRTGFEHRSPAMAACPGDEPVSRR